MKANSPSQPRIKSSKLEEQPLLTARVPNTDLAHCRHTTVPNHLEMDIFRLTDSQSDVIAERCRDSAAPAISRQRRRSNRFLSSGRPPCNVAVLHGPSYNSSATACS